MNETLKLFDNHRTIRFFKERKVEKEKLEALMEAFRRSPNSMGLQESTIIRIRDQKLKDALAAIGEQDYIARVPELMVFVADNYRNYRIAMENGCHEDPPTIEMLIQGLTDSIIGAQSVNIAAESMGLGVVYLGSILKGTDKLIDLLKLPKYTLPVVGMGIGYPDDDPQLKPRMDIEKRCFENRYEIFDNYGKLLKDYDAQMLNYYDTRDKGRRSESFTGHATKLYDLLTKVDSKAVDILKRQGYKI
ncbi:nitroreductase family protein [Peptoniphilus catoniae]|uniref:nitroreductase family protein n=1 Tax=Peptoniphilus catoniae TaxID=1660341 RepID=UPI0010FDA864|nr:nitroreductase family protein [Peptoniphilus catoniae]